MSRLIRLDRTGHTTLAEWTPDDLTAVESARAHLKAALEQGFLAVRSDPDGLAEQVRTLPLDADLIVLRRPIAGG